MRWNVAFFADVLSDDYVLERDGQPTYSAPVFSQLVKEHEGQTVEMSLQRGDKRTTTSVSLSHYEAQATGVIGVLSKPARSTPSGRDVGRHPHRRSYRMAAPATHRQLPLAVQDVQRAPMPTRRGEGDTRGQGDLDHRGVTLPAAQPH
jgi:hypothetical protein